MSRSDQKLPQSQPNAGLLSLCWCLRVGLALQCVAVIHLSLAYYTPINTWLFMECGLPEETAKLVDQIGAGVLALCALSALCAPRLPALALMSTWFILLSLSTWSAAAHPYVWLAPANQALRALSPIALWLLLRSDRTPTAEHSKRQRLSGLWLLRLCIAATFAGHGLMATWQHPPFIDLILGSVRKLTPWSLSEARASGLLVAVGILDLGMAALILVRPFRSIALYMACWALITALSRMTERGVTAWPETLLRTVHWLAPLGLFLYWSQLKRNATVSGNPLGYS